MKALPIAFSAIVVVVASIVSTKAWSVAPHPDYLAIGNFAVVSLTLIVLIWYAADTNTIARLTQERWNREGVLSATYGLQLVGHKGDVGRTLVVLNNPSSLLVRARFAGDFRVYGEPVQAGELYDGKDVWLLFPQQSSQGWFEVESLLQRKGKTVAVMMSECTPANRTEQLTMLLTIEFWDELGARRKLPGRHHYFDFERWAWIPQLAETAS